MFRRSALLCAMLAAAAWPALPAYAAEGDDDSALVVIPARAETPVTGEGSLSAAMAAIRAGRWDAARAQIDAMRDRRLAAFARAELYLAPQSPRVEGDQLRALLSEAPDLPQSARLATLARRRGIADLPAIPDEQRLIWTGSAPRRGNPRTVSDSAAGLVRQSIQDRITNDDPAGAESILTGVMTNMTPDSRTEWQYRVAWSYYIENDDTNARRMAALAQTGTGEWASQADWAQGLASWRQQDCRAAMAAFRNVVGRASEPEMVAAGNYWFARAAVACGEPAQAQPALRRAAGLNETFYGQLASEALGITPRVDQETASDADRRRVAALPNVRAAQALAAAGESQLADQALRYQARIGPARDHAALAQIAGSLNLPETQLYLAYNAPQGTRPATGSRYPMPQWSPADGWRLNPALIYAHTLQESQFRTRVVSPAGAIGLMQLRPGTAGDMGLRSMGGDLTNPATNMALGQSYIEYLRDNGITGGLLPKVIAAYNAGSAPVQRWNSQVRDNGDPLLFIESIPYWETRAYVGTVLRNLWIYETELGTRSDSRTLLAQGRWPRVPEAPRRLASRGN